MTDAGDDLLERLREFHADYFPRHQQRFQDLVARGQHPTTLFIGCSDSRLVPYLLTGAGPGELFMVRNVGALVPPYEGLEPDPTEGAGGARRLARLHGTMAAIEFAVLSLQVRHIVVCGHSHCGAVRALYEGVPEQAVALRAWLRLATDAALPVQPTPEALRRTEQRAVEIQLARLMDYPFVRERVEEGRLALHGWHYVIESGEVHVFDAGVGGFVPADRASNAGTGPYMTWIEPPRPAMPDHPAA